MNNRINQLTGIMEAEGLDGILISGRPNVFYFSGFTGSVAKCLFTREKAFMVVDFRYDTQAKEQVFSGIEVIRYEKDPLKTLQDLCVQNRVESLGLEGMEISFQLYGNLEKELKAVKQFRDTQNQINRVRVIKSRAEADKIKKAAEIADAAFQDILPLVKPGAKEFELALELEYRMKKRGATGASFDIIAASGPRSALPHGVADLRELRSKDAIVMDFGAIYQGYCSDMTRTVFLGTPPKQLTDIYDLVLKAQTEALQQAAAGMTGKTLDKIARGIIDKAGYGKYFGHGLGHGVGIEIHEKPTVSPKSDDLLETGMVFTIEPGVYIEDLGGVRIEDMVYLSGESAQILTGTPKELLIL